MWPPLGKPRQWRRGREQTQSSHAWRDEQGGLREASAGTTAPGTRAGQRQGLVPGLAQSLGDRVGRARPRGRAAPVVEREELRVNSGDHEHFG